MNQSFSIKEAISSGRFWTGTCMVFGTAVGAGMLGIPSAMAGSGFSSALFVTFLVWLFMTGTGLLLLEVTLNMPPGANLIAVAARFLGSKGKWLAGGVFLFLYYCLLVAYFSGGAPLLGGVFSSCGTSLSPILEKCLFLFCFGGVIALGVKWIGRVNFVLTVGMFASYVALVTAAGSSPAASSETIPFSFAAGAIPVLFSAFGFHNIVPSLATYFGGRKNELRLAIVTGTSFAFLFYIVWIGLVLRLVPTDLLQESGRAGVPVVEALQIFCRNPSVAVFARAFAFFALTGSFLGVGFSFVDFIRDGFNERGRKVGRLFCCACTLLPPFVSVLINPSVFESALGIAGGLGESVLNGLLPTLLFAKMCQSIGRPVSTPFRSLLFSFILFSLFVVGIELQELLFL